MKILIVSGFLGAGKTTFIKELIRRTGQDIVILKNEYGDTNIDKGELSSSGDISVLELMEGCVCCTVREGFANSVLTIASALSPAFLIVEPTGAALLSRIIDNLSRITYGDISLLPPVTLVSPRGIDQSMACFGDIYADQLKAAEQIIFSNAKTRIPAHSVLQRRSYSKQRPPPAWLRSIIPAWARNGGWGCSVRKAGPPAYRKNTAMIFQNLDGGPWDMPGGRIASPYPQIYSAICH